MGQNKRKDQIHKMQADNFETPLMPAASVVSTVQAQALLLIASFKHVRRLQQGNELEGY